MTALEMLRENYLSGPTYGPGYDSILDALEREQAARDEGDLRVASDHRFEVETLEAYGSLLQGANEKIGDLAERIVRTSSDEAARSDALDILALLNGVGAIQPKVQA